MASWNKSTLSQLLVGLVAWLIAIIFAAWAVAIWAPAAYKLMSEDKTLVMVFGAAYLFILQGVRNAYIGARTPNAPVEKEDDVLPPTPQD